MNFHLCWPETVSDYSLVALAVGVCLLLIRRSRQMPFPPGPRGWPLLGMVFGHPKTEFWKTYAQWGKEYGNIGLISFHVLSRRIVVINSREMAETLLDQRGAIYSDRPFPTMSGLLMNRQKSMFYMSYTERLKSYRRLMHNEFNARAAQNYWSLQEQESRVFLHGLLQTPENVFGHIRRFSGAVIMKIGYGYEVKSENDYYLALAQEGMRVGSLAAAPGKWVVDSIPILRFLPSWFPGAGFKRKAAEWGHQLYSQSLEPHDYVKSEIASGMAVPSFTSKYLAPNDGPPANAEFEDIVFWTAGALYSAGSDSTASAVHTFFLAMTLYPDIQQRAQKEIDTVIGQHRLPTISDRGSLPFVEAIIKEVLRWGTVSPMAMPHTTAADDEVLGYKIPKGCLVIVNLWAMLNDETVYPEPHKFNPSRFLGDKQQPDPRELAFGRGRRVCPGQHVAETSVFIQIASILAAFNILRGLDDAGKEVEPEVGFTTAIVSYAKPFNCRIIPRREEIRSMVEQALEW